MIDDHHPSRRAVLAGAGATGASGLLPTGEAILLA
nr:twin-arginine translocation signal domain-containing protein [uncultured Sphingomonas sp.]